MQTETPVRPGPTRAEPARRDPLDDVARLAVTSFADYCVVDVLDAALHLHRATVHCSRRGEPALVRALRGTAPGTEPQLGTDHVLAGGGARMVPRLRPDWVEALGLAGDQLELIAGRTPVSAVVVPLPPEERPLGALTLLSLEPTGFPPRALEQAGSLANLAAAALDRDRWHRAAAVAERARQEFLAVVSHELRTPLTSIVGYTDLLRSGMSGPLNEIQRERVDRIADSAWSLVREMEQILDLVRAQSTGSRVRLDRLELASFTSGVARLVEPIARDKGLEFRIERPEVREEIVTDPDKLRRALLNLLHNAIHFTRFGSVSLVATAPNGRVRFAVRDTGIGIPADQQPLIFEPFWRGATTHGGMGLGLSLALELVRQLDGDITVESTPGTGTCFTVDLPRRPQQGAPAGPSLPL